MMTLPKRGRGYQSDAARARYDAGLAAFCAAILEQVRRAVVSIVGEEFGA